MSEQTASYFADDAQYELRAIEAPRVRLRPTCFERWTAQRCNSPATHALYSMAGEWLAEFCLPHARVFLKERREQRERAQGDT